MAERRTTGSMRRAPRDASATATASRTLRDVMSVEPVSIGIDGRVRQLAMLLREHEFSVLPVLGADGHVVGVVSLTDLFRRHAESLLEGSPPTPLERLVEGFSRPWEPIGLEDEPVSGG